MTGCHRHRISWTRCCNVETIVKTMLSKFVPNMPKLEQWLPCPSHVLSKMWPFFCSFSPFHAIYPPINNLLWCFVLFPTTICIHTMVTPCKDYVLTVLVWKMWQLLNHVHHFVFSQATNSLEISKGLEICNLGNPPGEFPPILEGSTLVIDLDFGSLSLEDITGILAILFALNSINIVRSWDCNDMASS